MKHLEKIWADGSAPELQNIGFIFHVALNDVHFDEDIENIIVEQHKGLKGNGVQPAEIKTILRGPSSQRVVIIYDGHDEYKRGTNSDIDNSITKDYLRTCMIILSSRETELLAQIREHVNTEVEITGFDKQGVKEYATRYLESSERCEQLLEKAEACEINSSMFDYGILHIPIFLNMICVLFKCNISILKGKIAVLSAIVERCPDWEAIRKSGKKRMNDATKDVIVKLGKLSLDGLLQEQPKLSFTKVCFFVYKLM